MTDSDAEAAETQVILDFARDCGYPANDNYSQLTSGYQEVGRMLQGMIDRPDSFCK